VHPQTSLGRLANRRWLPVPLLLIACTQGRQQDTSPGGGDGVRAGAAATTSAPGLPRSPVASATCRATRPLGSVDLLHRTASVVARRWQQHRRVSGRRAAGDELATQSTRSPVVARVHHAFWAADPGTE